MRQEFTSWNTFPSPVLTGSGSEGMISALHSNSKTQIPNSKRKCSFNETVEFDFCFLGFVPDVRRYWAPHCVKNQCKVKCFGPEIKANYKKAIYRIYGFTSSISFIVDLSCSR
jgi:hypothetical protein